MTMDIMEMTSQTEKYLTTLKKLRSRNFSKNLPFLILSEQLPEGQVYREYADGRIELQAVSTNDSNYPIQVLKVLSGLEADRIREAHGVC